MATLSAMTPTADQPQASEAHRQAARRAVLLMRERMGEDLSLDMLAEAACMSPYHFNRVFRRLVGIPPSQFLSALRLEAAKRLLLTTQESITDICFEVGYNSLGTFTSRFTHLVGLSPSQFRILSEAFQPASADELLHMLSSPNEQRGPVLEGSIEAGPEVTGLIFLGLFPKAIPQDRPVACAILEQAGSYALQMPNDSKPYYLFGAGLARAERPLDYLICGGCIRGVGSIGPLRVFDQGDEGMVIEGPRDLSLRPPDLLDPPLLVTLPLLIDERLTAQIQALEASTLAQTSAEPLAAV